MSVIDVLRPHNQEAFQEISKMIESGIRRIAAPRATGSGKTYLMGALAEKYNNDKKLVLEPTRPLLKSIKEKFDEFGIKNTDFIPYQKLIRISDEDIAGMNYKLIFLDECHHCVSPVWGMKVNCLINSHSDSIIFGTSATTVRNDGVDVVKTLFEGNAIGELPLSTAIARKVLPCPHYITAIYRLDDEFEKLKKKVESSTNTKTEKKEFYKKMQEMKLHFEKSYGVPLILNKYIKVRDGRYLVFCKGKKHLDAMRDVVIEWFHTAGIKNVHSYAVYSDYPDKEKDYKDFCEDNSDSVKILFSINILNEGVHIKDISGVLMLRTTQSNLIYLQQLGRLVEAENLDKYLVVFDFVNNFSSVNDGVGLLKEIKDAVTREKESNPDFDDSGFEDIDTFFVIEQVLEVQEMFREIEGRLKGKEWTKEEIEILKKWYPTGGQRECIKRLSYKSRLAIISKANSLGITMNKRGIFSNEEDKIIENYYPTEGANVYKRLNNKTEKQCHSRAIFLGISCNNSVKIWTDEEDKIIKKYYPTEQSTVYKRLIDRSKSACMQRAIKLGIASKNDKTSWTNEEYKILKEYYPQVGSDVSVMLNRSKNACATMAYKLGIKQRKKKSKYKYVCKRRNKYLVGFTVNGKRMQFGRFDSEEEAAKVAMQKANEYGKAI